MEKSKGNRGKRANLKARARATSPDMILEFLELPPELRNMVYDELWKMNNRIAAYHTQSQTGILAYYDGTTLEIELFHLDDFAGEILDIELLDQVRAQVKALLGNDFTEIVTPTATTAHGGYFDDRQLFDHFLVYSKT
ncbi:uncharacterized protein J4E79_009329 [Alternaria viburni]|uniref:uncharacterized protein n=1 Tax=Alternaria viburni TaxID=566460 RepID=UPI0020C4C04D|nr:uncharacterized protein J4E79_009329 [Alternaria viburni]KAI4651130.1 hypothetical protein J4E79_009329 [Alternaria viburni]KAI4706450.1 hypothetical protein J4E89_008868 [Alternaria sp. Ai002NY15]